MEAKERNSQLVEAVPQTSETTLSRTGTRTTPNKSNQATSSSAIGSSGGEHADKLAEPTVQGKNPMSENKGPKKGLTTQPGRKEDGRCRAAERADSAPHSASHVRSADGADDAQFKNQAV